jgi:hypothetical protein
MSDAIHYAHDETTSTAETAETAEKNQRNSQRALRALRFDVAFSPRFSARFAVSALNVVPYVVSGFSRTVVSTYVASGFEITLTAETAETAEKNLRNSRRALRALRFNVALAPHP